MITNFGEFEDITRPYEIADVVINPINCGTGLSVKTIEALGQCKPIVTTSIGARGLMKGANRAFLVADEASEFADFVVRVLTENSLYETLVENAYDFVTDWNYECQKSLERLLEFKK